MEIPGNPLEIRESHAFPMAFPWHFPGVEWFGTSSVRLFRGNDAVNGVELEDGEAMEFSWDLHGIWLDQSFQNRIWLGILIGFDRILNFLDGSY